MIYFYIHKSIFIDYYIKLARITFPNILLAHNLFSMSEEYIIRNSRDASHELTVRKSRSCINDIAITLHGTGIVYDFRKIIAIYSFRNSLVRVRYLNINFDILRIKTYAMLSYFIYLFPHFYIFSYIFMHNAFY